MSDATPTQDDCLSHRATTWRLRTQTLACGRRPLVMGIVNVTPDSFSDGGKFHATDAAIEHALALEAEGADILDIGGESTRPYSDAIDTAEELCRVQPVLEAVCQQAKIPVSIDTSKAEVARAAMEAGAEILNDVTGLEGDPAMIRVAREFQPGICAMHMQGNPRTMQDKPTYDNVVEDILVYLRQRRDTLSEAGIHPDQISLDPGLGFGKSHEHNLRLLIECYRFHELGCPLLVGHSRKGFLAKVLGDKDADRTAATLGVSLALAQQGVQILRVHDVAPTHHALLLFETSGGLANL